MCKVNNLVRNFIDSGERDFRNACKMDERYTDHKHPDRKRVCCASRTVWNVGRLEENFPNDDDYEMGYVWDPFSNTEADFRVTDDCDSITEETAAEVRSILEDCAVFFDASVDGELIQCAAAAQIVDPVKNPNIVSEEYTLAFGKVLECSGKIPNKVRRWLGLNLRGKRNDGVFMSSNANLSYIAPYSA